MQQGSAFLFVLPDIVYRYRAKLHCRQMKIPEPRIYIFFSFLLWFLLEVNLGSVFVSWACPSPEFYSPAGESDLCPNFTQNTDCTEHFFLNCMLCPACSTNTSSSLFQGIAFHVTGRYEGKICEDIPSRYIFQGSWLNFVNVSKPCSGLDSSLGNLCAFFITMLHMNQKWIPVDLLWIFHPSLKIWSQVKSK